MLTDEHDQDDDWASRLADLDEPADVIDVTVISNHEIMIRFSRVRERLYELNEMEHPSTDEGRELHSLRSAILVEMSKRGLR